MKLISLTRGRFAMVDDEDFDRAMQFNWCEFEGRNTWYAHKGIGTRKNQSSLSLHRFIMGDMPAGRKMQIDHIDGNGLNNQKSNLRWCTYSENAMNAHKNRNGSSNYKGVDLQRKTKLWRCRIKINYIEIHGGYFRNEIDAAKKYDEMAIKYFGEFAKLNFKKSA